jgi:hypothetical protein
MVNETHQVEVESDHINDLTARLADKPRRLVVGLPPSRLGS